MRYEVDAVLAATKDAFETWRYKFEEHRRLFYGLEEFCDALQEYILGIEPSWRDCLEPL
jgi:hypothetical protein